MCVNEKKSLNLRLRQTRKYKKQVATTNEEWEQRVRTLSEMEHKALLTRLRSGWIDRWNGLIGGFLNEQRLRKFGFRNP